MSNKVKMWLAFATVLACAAAGYTLLALLALVLEFYFAYQWVTE